MSLSREFHTSEPSCCILVASASRTETDKRADSKILNELINYTYADEKKTDALGKNLLTQDLPNNKSHIENKIPNLF